MQDGSLARVVWGDTPLYGVYRYVRPQRVEFFRCFYLKYCRVSIFAILVLHGVRF